MSCCGANCGCGSGCKCGNGCRGGCKMYPENEMDEAPSKGSKAVTGAHNVASPSPSKENPSSATGADNGGCKCNPCTCNPCACK